MSDELTTTVPLPMRRGAGGPLLRVRHGMRLTHNWLQLVRFAAVGFLTVSLIAFGFTYVVLVALVDAGVMKVLAQAIAIAAGTPLSFVGQKLWSFRA